MSLFPLVFRTCGRPALAWGIGLVAGQISATQINWNSTAFAVNQTSSGAALDEGFQFELGAFTPGFVPTAANTAQWAGQWTAASRSLYDTGGRRFANSCVYSANVGPFLTTNQGYIWGFNGAAANGEWVLMTNPSWKWPQGSDFPGQLPEQWTVSVATSTVVGQINGASVLIRTQSIASSPPPQMTGDEWRALYFTASELADLAVSGWAADPDKDGVTNLLEFAFGTPPRKSGAKTPSFAWFDASGSRYASLVAARNAKALATWTVQVSGDLKTWSSGATFTTTLQNTPDLLQVRDNQPFAPGQKRFLRLVVVPQ